MDIEAYLDHAAAGVREAALLAELLRTAASVMMPAALTAYLASDEVEMTLEGAFHEGKGDCVEALVESAAAHGRESLCDHEVGDLQAYLRAVVPHLDERATAMFAARADVLTGHTRSFPAP